MAKKRNPFRNVSLSEESMDGFLKFNFEETHSPTLYPCASAEDTLQHHESFFSDSYFTKTPSKWRREEEPVIALDCERKKKKARKSPVFRRVAVVDLTGMVELLDINMDCIVWILQWCDAKDLAVVRRVCTDFKKYAEKSLAFTNSAYLSTVETARAHRRSTRIQNVYMSKMTFPDFKDIQGDFKKILDNNHTKIKTLSLTSEASMRIVEEKNLPNLENLSIFLRKQDGCTLKPTHTLYSLLNQQTSTLKTLSINLHKPLLAIEMKQATQIKNLRSLTIDSFKHGTLEQIVKNFPNLTELSLKHGHFNRADRAALKKDGTKLSKLRKAEFLSVKTPVTAHMYLVDFLDIAPELEHLSITSIPNFSSRLLFKRLKREKKFLGALKHVDLDVNLTKDFECPDGSVCDFMALVAPNIESLRLRSRSVAFVAQKLFVKSKRLPKCRELFLDGYFHWNMLWFVAHSGCFPALEYLLFDLRTLQPVPSFAQTVEEECKEIKQIFSTMPGLTLCAGQIGGILEN